jgi:hypothetical protein
LIILFMCFSLSRHFACTAGRMLMFFENVTYCDITA